MVFGIHSGKAAPQLDDDGHYFDPNMPATYDRGPANRAYISDPSHPEYDPGIDPNLQLRSVRTAAESIAESHRSEARRESRAKAKRKASILGRLGRGKTLNRGKSTKSRKQGPSVIAELVQDELDRLRNDNETEQTGAQGSGGEGVGVAFDSAQQYDTPFEPTADVAEAAEQAAKEEAKSSGSDLDQGVKKGKVKPAKRRNVYLNITPTSSQEVDKRGEPLARYPRNKVRTSKYTVVTFLPRFLSEQFRRLANVYFLFLVLLQTSTLFGATVPQIAMLPLVAILGITAIKDSIEDYRRHVLDNQVNNSAVTRLGNWRNVNQRTDTRTWLTRHFRKNRPAKVSKGVRKLREKEDAIGMGPIRGSANRETKEEVYEGGTGMERQSSARTRSDSLLSRPGQYLETIASESEHPNNSTAKLAMNSTNKLIGQSTTTLEQKPDDSRISLPDGLGVVDYRRSTRGTARWERTLWKKLEVGDVILLRENEQVPADLVLLNSSDPDGNAFVETKNLDGETNLKVKKCVKSTMSIQTEEDVEHARFVIDSEPPHANLYSYSALLKYERASSDASTNGASPVVVEPVTANELLLRGCALRNTEWVIGIVVFTGRDTKILLNGGDTPSKRSKIEKETNVNVAVNFGFLLVMCSACAVVGGLLLNSSDGSRNFYEPGSETSSSNIINALVIFGCCLVLFQNIVPISLYISIELTKTISAFFIYQDIDMYYEPLDHPCVPKTWGIVDDLGQIEYIFSDKTGTLTQNVMEFKKCSINGISYGEGITEAMIGSMKRQGKDTSGTDPEEQRAHLEVLKEQMIAKLNQTFKNRYLRPDKVTLISTHLSDAIASRTEADQRQKIITFFRALALCHTALADRTDSGNPFTLEYKAQSPDEAALVSAARDIGAVFINKNNNVVDIEIMGQPERYTPLKVLEFNSTRKRMSIIVRDIEGRILLICKGADSVIYQKLRPDHPEELKKTTQKDLEDFANAGLRTLCIAQRYLEEGEYLEWSRLHDEAAASLTDRDDAIDEACEQIEHSLTLLGATALEDKLQVGVPETIEKLHQAGIKLWILTGDKLQTAIEIGFSCNLLSSDMEIMIISADHEQGTRAQLEAACNKIAASGRPVVVRGKQRGMFKKSSKQEFLGEGVVNDKSQFAVVVDGETLKFCLDKNLKPLFLALTTQCETVICCRVSPAQKALTVRLVKDGMDCMTLAIGDGANDVSMIQEAHVGVGIAGLEGAQASMSADYAIGQFRFLAKLLLVHGHWNTYRIGVLHQVFFYKNIIWTFSLLLFQIFCQANATYLFDYSLVLLYNLIFTSLPVIMLGSLDQDLRAPALMSFPQTYAPGRKGQLYSRSQFWFACVDGVYQSIVCFMLPTAAYYWFPIVSAKGYTLDPLTALGCTIGASCVLSANLYCGLMLQNWSVIIWLVIILSNLSYFIWITIYSSSIFDSNFSSTAYELYASVEFWAVILLSVIVSLLPRYTWNAWSSSFRPSQGDIVRQGWVKGDLKQRLGVRPGGEKFINESNLETGDSFNDGYDEPRSSDPVLSGFKERSTSNQTAKKNKRDTLGARESGMMGRSLESSFSFYDPDTLPATYTPDVQVSPQLSKHRLDEDESQLRGDETYSEYQHDPRSTLPEINIQRASWSSNYPYPSTSTSIEGPAITSRTALASSSTDSFENQFQNAFADQATPPRPSPHRQPSQKSIDSESPTSPQRYHSRFAQSDSNTFHFDTSGGSEDLVTPPRPIDQSHRQDSDSDVFHTPTSKGHRHPSEGATF
jgi:phospholipid-translocating ATPase